MTSSPSVGVEEAGLVGGSPDASFGFYLKEAFQFPTPDQHRKHIIQLELLGTDMV